MGSNVVSTVVKPGKKNQMLLAYGPVLWPGTYYGHFPVSGNVVQLSL